MAMVAALVAAMLLLLTMRHPPAVAPAIAASALARPMVQIVTGQIEARHTVSVELFKPGTVDELLIDVGQSVIEGQVMARLTTSTANDAIAVALLAAQAKAAEAKSAAGETKLEAAKAKADAQRAKEQAMRARQVFEREQKLMDAGATPRQVLERAQHEFEAAQTESTKLDEASRQMDNSTYAAADQLREAMGALEIAQKEDLRGRAAIAAAEIHAPATGLVVWRKGAEESKEIYRIAVDPDQLRAVFAAEKIKLGATVLITVPSLNIAPIHAVVSAIENDRAVAEFASPSPAIRPGAQCTVSVQLK